MAIDLDEPSEDVLAFLAERHLATLTSPRPDGTPHVAPVCFTYEPAERLARVITFADAVRVRLIGSGARVALCIDECNGSEQIATTAADGTFTELRTGFGGFAGETLIIVAVTTLEEQRVFYQAVFGESDEPTIANPSCETPCDPSFLNFTIAR